MGQSRASASILRYNGRMATEAKYQAAKALRAPTNPTHGDPTLTPQEFAEFIDSLEYDEAPAAVADCADYDSEQRLTEFLSAARRGGHGRRPIDRRRIALARERRRRKK